MKEDQGHQGILLWRRVARETLRRNAFVQLQMHDRAMVRALFLAILLTFVFLRLYSLFCVLAAAQGWFLDPQVWAAGHTVTTAHTTPFHGYPNPFGTRFGFQFFVTAHGFTGALLFVCCLIPLWTRKGAPLHVAAGRAFLLLWLLHLLDGLINSGQILVTRGFAPLRYYDTIGQGFSLYLYIQFGFVSSMVIDFLAHGLAALQYKNQPPSRLVRLVMLLLPTTSLLFGVAIALWGAWRLGAGGPPETPNTYPFAIVFVVQIPAYLYLIVRNIQYWLRATPRRWLHGWLLEHQRNMMFCVQVTLYTGLANITQRFAPQLTPFFFGAIDIGFFVWIVLRERKLRQLVVGSRVGLALISLSRPHAKRRSHATASRRDSAWLFRRFDLDHSGELERHELRTLLERQGLSPNEEEIERIFAALDQDGNGRVDHHELADFLETWVCPDPTPADTLALAFRSLDRDGDGEITLEELRAALLDDKALSTQEIDALLHEADLDRSGTIDWNEFLTAMGGGAEA